MTRRLALAAAIVLAAGLVAVGIDHLRPVTEDDTSVRPTETQGGATETLDEQIERIARVVERVRELEFETIPEPTTLTLDELGDRVTEEISAYTVEEAASDQRILEALGAVPPGTDLRALIIRGYSEQVGGFYDPRTGELVVGVEEPGQRLGRLEEMILAHELQHALADAALGLPDLEEVPDGEEDEALAVQSLIEGDATITMQRYLEEGFSVVDQLLLPSELARLEEQLAGFTELPHYVQRSFTFPYEEGTGFVQHLLARGGWPAVDEAYAHPPSTTAEIIFPDRYPVAAAEDPTTTAPPEGWVSERTLAFGAADLLFLFEAPGNDPSAALDDPLAAVAGWRSGSLQLHTSGDAAAVSISLGTETSSTLCPAVEAWYDAAHGDDTREQSTEDLARWQGGTWSATLVCGDETIALGIAPTPELASALVGR